jgi:hypothetical protein
MSASACPLASRKLSRVGRTTALQPTRPKSATADQVGHNQRACNRALHHGRRREGLSAQEARGDVLAITAAIEAVITDMAFDVLAETTPESGSRPLGPPAKRV